MDTQAVQLVRSLNRTVAARVGVLGDRFLGRGQPMGASRTLWEIGLSDGHVARSGVNPVAQFR